MYISLSLSLSLDIYIYIYIYIYRARGEARLIVGGTAGGLVAGLRGPLAIFNSDLRTNVQ